MMNRYELGAARPAAPKKTEDAMTKPIDDTKRDPNIVSHLVHTPACRAAKQIGRMGSRSGLHWARGDQGKCDCGALALLQQIRSAFGLAEIYHFNNNGFDEAEEWERRVFRARELLGEE